MGRILMVDLTLTGDAFTKGYDAAWEEDVYDNPYPVGTTAWNDYEHGYDTGREDLELVEAEEAERDAFLETWKRGRHMRRSKNATSTA